MNTPTEEQINRHKDFDSILNAYYKAGSHRKPHERWVWMAAASMALFLIISIYIKIARNTEGPFTHLTHMVKRYEPISPPIPQLDVAYEIQQLNPNQNNSIHFASGSFMKIPAHSFEDTSGHVVDNEVTISYREIPDPLSMFAAGVDVGYDSSGIQYHFNTAAMFEVLGHCDDKPVRLIKGARLEVTVRSYMMDTSCSVYHFDDNINRWQYRLKDTLQFKSLFPQVLGLGDAAANKQYLEERIEDIHQQMNDLAGDFRIDIYGLEEPLKPTQLDYSAYVFEVNFDKDVYRELAPYKNLVWQVIDPPEGFTRTEVYSHSWQDVHLTRIEETSQYKLHLGNETSQYDLVVQPGFIGNDYQAAMKAYEGSYVAYNKMMQNIQEEYDDQIAGLRIEEQVVTNKLSQLENNRSVDSTIAFRSFVIDEFGLWNSNLLIPDEKLDTGRPMIFPAEISTVFAVDKDVNSLFTYHPDESRTLNFTPNQVVWAMGMDEQLYGARIYNQSWIFEPIERHPENLQRLGLLLGLQSSLWDRKRQDKSTERLRKLLLFY